MSANPNIRDLLCALWLLLALPALAQDIEAISSYTLNTGDHVQVTVFE